MEESFYYFYIYIYKRIQLKIDNPHVSENIKIGNQHSYMIDLFAFLICFLKLHDKLSKDTLSNGQVI